MKTLEQKYNELLKIMICADFRNTEGVLNCECCEDDVCNDLITLKQELDEISQKLDNIIYILSHKNDNKKNSKKENNNGGC